ncbi:MAG: gluconokinase [Sphingomonas fennica]
MTYLVVMGVSGSGKSTLGAALATSLDVPFIEGDDLHPPANLRRMAAGIPLTDDDRAPFLDAVAAALAAEPGGAVAACSALKRAYRDRIRRVVPEARFILVHLDGIALAARPASREGHFMPASLLDSQLATLEPPQADEAALTVDGSEALATQIERVRAFVGRGRSMDERAG